MITKSDVVKVGQVNKPHGVNGEFSASFYDEAVVENLDTGDCLLFELQGLYVPFFVSEVRPRGNESLLVSLDDETTKEAVSAFTEKEIYMTREAVAKMKGIDRDDPAVEEGLYAAQLIGYKAVDVDNNEIGTIKDIIDSTDNPLFVLKTPGSKSDVYVPITDDFIDDIDGEEHTITFVLPDGLLDLND